MHGIDDRIRIAILWVAWAAAVGFSLLLWMLMEPDALDEALAGKIEGMDANSAVGLYLAASGIIPLGLAVMTLQFDTRATRYTNLIAGALLGAWGVLEVAGHLAVNELNASSLVSLAAVGIASLIAAISVKALRRTTPERSARTHEVIDPEPTTTV